MHQHVEIALLLRDQFGVVSYTQLLKAGLSSRSISRQVSAVRFQLVMPGIVRSVEQVFGFDARAMALQLSVGADGALSGPTAARIYGARGMPEASAHACCRRRSRRAVPAWVERSTCPWIFHAPDAERVLGPWKLLAPLSTLLTVAMWGTDHRFERTAEDFWHRRLVSPGEAAEFLAAHRRRGRDGVARFDRWLARIAERERASQSGFELDVINAVRQLGLPEPQRQHPLLLASGELVHLDIAWSGATLAVEPGHSWWHGGDLATRRDQQRDNACGRLGLARHALRRVDPRGPRPPRRLRP